MALRKQIKELKNLMKNLIQLNFQSSNMVGMVKIKPLSKNHEKAIRPYIKRLFKWWRLGDSNS
jgi:hypothetical protein